MSKSPSKIKRRIGQILNHFIETNSVVNIPKVEYDWSYIRRKVKYLIQEIDQSLSKTKFEVIYIIGISIVSVIGIIGAIGSSYFEVGGGDKILVKYWFLISRKYY